MRHSRLNIILLAMCATLAIVVSTSNVSQSVAQEAAAPAGPAATPEEAPKEAAPPAAETPTTEGDTSTEAPMKKGSGETATETEEETPPTVQPKTDEPETDTAPAEPPKAPPAAPPETPPKTEPLNLMDQLADENAPAGLEDLDEATAQKVTAVSLADVNKVVDLLDSAIEKGLDPDNQEFAEQMLVSTLIQRARALSTAILTRKLPNPRQDPRWMQVRQFALTDLQRAVELDKSQWEAYMLIGQLHALPLGDMRAGRRAFGAVIRIEDVPDADRAKAYALRGATERDEPEKQLADYTHALELDAEKADYWRLRGENYYRHNKLAEALSDVDQAVKLDEEHAATHELRGMILLGQENYAEAEKSFDQATDLAPEAVLPYQHRSQLYHKQGDLDRAIEQLTKALDIKADDPVTLLTRARLYYEQKDTESALADIDAALKANPGLLKAYQMKSEILALDNRVKEAIATIKKVLDAVPDRRELVELHYQLATYYLIDNQGQVAIDTFTKVIGWAPENAAALRGRADAYLNLGDHAKAIADFHEALKYDEENEGLLNNLAWVLATSPEDELRDSDKAIELATKACESSAYQKPHILSTLAAAYAESGDFELAVKWASQAVELGRDSDSFPHLQKELKSYEDDKPWRELKPEEAAAKDSPTEEAAESSPATPTAPARTADF